MSDISVHSDEDVVTPDDVDTMSLPAPHRMLTVRSFGLTDPGKVRANNEDQFLIATLVKALQVQSTSLTRHTVPQGCDRSSLFIVADGLGGQAGGEEASALAVGSVETFVLDTFKWFARLTGPEEDKVLADFKSAVGQANAQVRAEATERPELRGMATTLTLAYSLNDQLFVAHVGDSRCYLYRQGVLCRLTRDHTLVQDMVRSGALAADQAEKHRWRHVVTNAVGGDSADVTVEVHQVHLEAGDRVLLCSDGLTNLVSEEDIARVLHAEPDPEPACRKLVAHANEAGGKDNITIVLALYESAPALARASG